MIEYNNYLSKIIYIYQFMYKNFTKRDTYGNWDPKIKLFKTSFKLSHNYIILCKNIIM